MKRLSILLTVVVSVVMLLPGEGFGQRRKAPPRKKNNAKTVKTTPPVVTDTVAMAPAVDTAAYNDSLLRANIVPQVTQSKRPSTTVVGNLVESKTPLAYDNIRIDDQVYKQIIWRDISIFENVIFYFHIPFKYVSC